MKTILLNEVIPSESCKNVTHYEIVEHKGKKFLIYVEGSNGNYLGFNQKCCLKVMNDNGSWDNVVDNHNLGFSANNDGMYYSHSIAKKKIIVDNNVKHFKEYISILY